MDDSGEVKPPLRTAWILGAGFSQPLGGPLFKDLFQSDVAIDHAIASPKPVASGEDDHSPMYREIMESEVLQARKRPEAVSLQLLRSNLQKYRNQIDPSRRKPTLPPWNDAEEFIDLLETARNVDHLAKLFGDNDGIKNGAPKTTALAAAFRRGLAIECDYFLKNVSVETEKWSPYRDWVTALGNQDTIITFNYDRVPDLLQEWKGGGNLRVVLPGTEYPDWNYKKCHENGMVPVLKLHGSMDWKIIEQDGSRKVVQGSPDLPLTIGDANFLAMGVPGPGKAVSRQAVFIDLWTAAIHAVGQAERIVFLGYRFPPTDSDARKEFLGAVRKIKHPVLIDVVLGPNLGAEHVVRMEGLLDACRATVRLVPMYVQDYLSLAKFL